MPSIIQRIESHVNPFVGLIIAIIAISTSAILIRAGSAPEQIMAFYRVLFTTILLAPLGLNYRDEFREIHHHDLISATLAGMALAAHFATWFESVNKTSIAASVTLVQMQPIFVAIGAALILDEQISKRMILGIGIAIIGSTVMSVPELIYGKGVAPEPFIGNMLALTGAIMAAGYVLAGRSIRQRVSLIPYVLVVYSVCVLVLLVVVLINGYPLFGYPPTEWGLFIAMAVGPGILGHTVINWSLEYIESSVVSITLIGEPVGSTLLAIIIFNEIPDIVTVIGGGILLFGIYITVQSRP